MGVLKNHKQANIKSGAEARGEHTLFTSKYGWTSSIIRKYLCIIRIISEKENTGRGKQLMERRY